MKEIRGFFEIARTFAANINALHVFSERIGEAADEHDQKVVREFTDRFKDLVDLNLVKTETGKILLERGDQQLPGGDSDENQAQNEETTETFEHTNPSPKIVQNDIKLRQLIDVLSSFVKQSPMQGNLLRRSALIALVSYFELLISELIQAHYVRYPAALPSEDRVLSLADLRSLGSIKEAEKHLIAREAELVLRKTTQEQLDYFNKRLKIDLSSLNSCLDDLYEIIQRRNLFVHNDGIVNRVYLSHVPSSYIEAHKIKKDEPLTVKTGYLFDSINTIFIVGAILIQQCWRKWQKDELEESEEYLMDQIYDSLMNANYRVTTNLATYARSIGNTQDHKLRLITINHSIALKELGQLQEMENLLNSLDWSSCALKFRLALHVLHDNLDEFYKLLPKAIAAEEVDREAIEEWPLFRHLRNNERFSEVTSHHLTEEV